MIGDLNSEQKIVTWESAVDLEKQNPFKQAMEYWVNTKRENSTLRFLHDDFTRVMFRNLDEFLRQHKYRITCAEIDAIFLKFWADLKMYKGNSRNLSGLSELLILRPLCYLVLGDEIKPVRRNKSSFDCGGFTSEACPHITVYTEYPVQIDPPITQKNGKPRTMQTDIAVKDGNSNLLKVIEIKSGLPSPSSEERGLRATLQKLRSLKDSRTLLITFWDTGLEESLKTLKNDKSFVLRKEECCRLWDNKQTLREVFEQSLGLPVK